MLIFVVDLFNSICTVGTCNFINIFLQKLQIRDINFSVDITKITILRDTEMEWTRANNLKVRIPAIYVLTVVAMATTISLKSKQTQVVIFGTKEYFGTVYGISRLVRR